MSVKINLKDFYPWYTHDEFVEVPDVIAAELIADRRYENAYQRRTTYNKAHFSLDVDDGIEASAVMFGDNSPESMCIVAEFYCKLCKALNSLPENQGRRIDEHYLRGKSQRDIAKEEGVNERNVRHSIKKGLAALRKKL